MAYQHGRIAAEMHGEQANHDELAHDRIAECCRMIGCTPDQLVSHVRMMAADRRDREQEADAEERADLRRWAHMRGVRGVRA